EGPESWAVSQNAEGEKKKIAIRVFRGGNPKGIPDEDRTEKKEIGLLAGEMGKHSAKTVSGSSTSNNKRTETSTACFRFHLRCVADTLQSTSNGATTKSPEASPSHQVSQIGQ